MPVTKSAAKRHRQSLKRRLRNRVAKSTIRSSVRSVRGSVFKGDREEAEANFKVLRKLIDTARGKGILHARTADRKKSRLAKSIAKIS